MGDQNTVSVEVRSELLKIVQDLERITKAQEDVGAGLKKTMENVGDAVDKETKAVESGLDRLKRFGSRVADQLRNDFKSLFALNAVGGALKLSNQFAGSVKETVQLSDTIRKLGSTFGIASKDFSSFQTQMTKGLGEIGLSSEAAARTLEGLADVPVRGQGNLLGYAKSAGQLASIGGQKGREGEIAGGIARLIQARGGNVNDMGAVGGIAEDLRRAKNSTGKAPTELLSSMTQIYTGMADDLRKQISTRGLTNLAAAGASAGPNATVFLQEFVKMSKYQRAGMEARGVGQVLGEQGVNADAVRKLYAEAKRLGGGDVRLGVKAATGVSSDEAAEGFIRLAESMDRVKAAQDGVRDSQGNLESQYRSSMGMGEAFQANINRVKRLAASPLSAATQKGTDMLSGAAGSDLGAAGVVAGGALTAAVLAGGGLRGIGRGLIGGELKSKAIEQLTGEKVQKVEVINWPGDFGGTAGGAGGGLKGKLGKAGMIAGAGLAAYELISAANDSSMGKTSEGFEGSAIERVIFKLDKLLGGSAAKGIMSAEQKLNVKVGVEVQSQSLRKTKPPGRGTAN